MPVAGSEEDKKRKVGEFSDLSIIVPGSGMLSNQIVLIMINIEHYVLENCLDVPDWQNKLELLHISSLLSTSP